MHRMISIALVAVLAACTAQAQDVARVAELTAKVDSTLRRINARTESTRTPGLASVRMEVPTARTPEATAGFAHAGKRRGSCEISDHRRPSRSAGNGPTVRDVS